MNGMSTLGLLRVSSKDAGAVIDCTDVIVAIKATAIEVTAMVPIPADYKVSSVKALY